MRILISAWLLPASFLFATPPRAEALTADEIIERMEANQTHSTAIIEGRLVISDRFGDRSSTYIAHSEGADRFLVEFTSRAEEGQRVLRRDDSLYLYYPDARETIRLQGAALRDNLLGSDISYEDMTGGRGLASDYRFTLIGEDEVDGYPSYKVELVARTTSVAYPRQVYWVDREEFVLRRAEQFARSGRLLKTVHVLETMRRDGYHFPSRMRVVDETRRSSGTEMIIESARLGVSLPRNIFSLDALTW
ncbi:MAG: outer membrane lipoprotein-sorting protein [Spirochaetaceae bacterium]|nr:MAG: outer membrane lipoprotein-sorting protein [Spirochaetaceae bacterium]